MITINTVEPLYRKQHIGVEYVYTEDVRQMIKRDPTLCCCRTLHNFCYEIPRKSEDGVTGLGSTVVKTVFHTKLLMIFNSAFCRKHFS